MDLKYRNIADKLEQQINDGTWEQGNKLPSIRNLSRELKVSIGTIQQAYALLEDKEIISSRNRSGYYINSRNAIQIDPPEKISFNSKPKEINIMETSISIMKSTEENTLYPMGSAVPNIDAKAIKQIHNSIKKFALYTPNCYEGPQGYLPLRKQIAKRSIKTGKTYNENEIIITSGCQEALTIALQVTTEQGDLVAVESPCYYGILQTLEILGRKVLEIPVSPTEGMDLNHFEYLLKQHPVKAVIINPAYSNPTGYTYTDSQKKHLSDLSTKYQLPLIEDDIFAELGINYCRPRTIHSFDKNGYTILCSSFSKTLSQDLRIGWMVAGRYFKKARAYKYASTLGTSSLQQFALADFLSTQNFERHLRHISLEYKKRQTYFLKLIQNHFPEGTKASHPQGGFLCWLKLGDHVNSMKLYNSAMELGIGITPGELFSPSNRYKNYIRLNYGYIKIEKMDEILHLLSTLI